MAAVAHLIAGDYHMLAPSHRRAAEDIEATIASIAGHPQAARVIIQESWAAAFHWIAYGTQTEHGSHQDSHARLGTYLRTLGETAVADRRESLERLRQGGMYGQQTHPANVQRAQQDVEAVRVWALS